MSSQYSRFDYVDALHHIDPGSGRDDWIRACMAAKSAGIDDDAIVHWSSTAHNFRGEPDVRSTLKSMKIDGGITAGTLVFLAKQHGWRPAALPGITALTPAATAAVHRLDDVWSACTPATEDHPYIQRKRGVAAGLRTVPADHNLHIAGTPVAGALALPVRDARGAIISMVFITGNGVKLNMPGYPMVGTFTVGDISTGHETVYLCEGIGQAWACSRSTGRPAIVTFGWGRMKHAAADILEKHPKVSMVLVPDVGKEGPALQLARDLKIKVATMPSGWAKNDDVNDLALREGDEALARLLDKATYPYRYRLLGAGDIMDLPPVKWLVHGVIPATGLASIFGPPGSGKSFLAQDLACAIGEGRAWFGHPVCPAPVVYLSLEGRGGVKARVQAWQSHHGRELPDAVKIVMEPLLLTSKADVDELTEAVKRLGPGAVVIIDTLNRAAGGADENSSAEMGRILDAAMDLQMRIDGLVLMVHHTGKDSSKGPRGHSSFMAALDAAIEVTRSGDLREWRVAKSKDGPDSAAHEFTLETVELGLDNYGQTSTSCVVVPSEIPSIRLRDLPKGVNQNAAYRAIQGALAAKGPEGRDSPPSLTLHEVIEVVKPALPDTVPQKRRGERSKAAVEDLIKHGHLVLDGDHIFPAIPAALPF